MKKSIEIYGYRKILDRTLDSLKSSGICEENKEAILKFQEQCFSEGLSLARIIKYLNTLHRIAILLGKPFAEAKKDDILKLVQRIEQGNYSDWTKRDYKIIIRKFYKWLRNSEGYPEEVKWIKASMRKNSLLPEELLTEEEVKKMAEVADNPRDKALVLVLYESGCRIGEILSLRIKHVCFDEYGAQLIVNGKTGSRRVRIIASSPNLASWLDNHPIKDSESPLWTSLRSKNEPLTYSAAKELLKELARKSGIRKRVYPHLFRHSRATMLANFLTEAQMKEYFGWVQGSRMASTYVHLSGRNLDEALLRIHGLSEEKKKEDVFKAIVCPRCKERNSPIARFCNKCGLALDVKTAIELDERRRSADELMSVLLQDAEVRELIARKIAEIDLKSDSIHY
jgi:integrase/ribosomal protein L40E